MKDIVKSMKAGYRLTDEMGKRHNRYFPKGNIYVANKSMKSHPTLLAIKESKLEHYKTSAHQLEQLKLEITNADDVEKKNRSLIH